MISEVNFYDTVYFGVKDLLVAIYTIRTNRQHSHIGVDVFRKKFEGKVLKDDRGVKDVEEMLEWLITDEIGQSYPCEIEYFIRSRLKDYKRQSPTLPNPICVYMGGSDQIISRLNAVINYLQHNQENN